MEQRVNNEPSPVDPARAERDRTFAARWKHGELFNNGYLPVPSHFLRHYAILRPHALTVGEAMFVLQLMSFKWDVNPPFPGYATLAKRMGVTDKMVRRYAKNLEGKKYLIRNQRDGKSNTFDLTPLFDALKKSLYLKTEPPAENVAPSE